MPMPLPHEHASLEDSTLIDVVRLIRSENVGPITFFQLIRRFGSAGKALDAIPDLARRGGRKKPITIFPASQAETEIEKTTLFGGRMVCFSDSDYPALLRQISDPPPVLAVTGKSELWANKPMVAIVGARNASANGCNFTKKIARELGEAGVIVVSGLARGIDTHAHHGAFLTGTAAVIAGGIDNVYPPENAELFDAMRKDGAILSEQPFGTLPHRQRFHGRNRIIAGMSRGTLVVEAAQRSGSLITARFALEQNREVFAVPGSPMDPRCHGTNKLIKDGATLTESVDDILETLRRIEPMQMKEPQGSLFSSQPPDEPEESVLQDAHAQLDEKLSATPTDIDTLVEQTGLPTSLILTILLEKELAGVIQRHAGGKVSVVYHKE